MWLKREGYQFAILFYFFTSKLHRLYTLCIGGVISVRFVAMKEQHEKFEYTPSLHLEGVKLLTATMQNFTYDRHAHEEYSIGLTKAGRQDFFCGGVFNKSYAGHVIFFNPEDVHDGCAGGSSLLEYDILYLPEDKLIPLMQAMGSHHPNRFRLKYHVLNDPILGYQVSQMSEILRQNSSAIEQEAALIQITESIIRLNGVAETPTFPRYKKDMLLIRAKDFIHSHLDKNISVDEISSAANISKYHFIRVFRQQFGITPHQYVLNCRLNQARKELESGQSVTMVAQTYGFADDSHLIRKFKRTFGMTPKQYQRQLSL
jgi:AraC-like DNA-binding protein